MRFTSYMTEEERKDFLDSQRFYYVNFKDHNLPKTVHMVNRPNVSIKDDEINGPEILLFNKPANAEVFNDIKEAREWVNSETISGLESLNQDDMQYIMDMANKIVEARNRIEERKKTIEELRKLQSK